MLKESTAGPSEGCQADGLAQFLDTDVRVFDLFIIGNFVSHKYNRDAQKFMEVVEVICKLMREEAVGMYVDHSTRKIQTIKYISRRSAQKKHKHTRASTYTHIHACRHLHTHASTHKQLTSSAVSHPRRNNLLKDCKLVWYM